MTRVQRIIDGSIRLNFVYQHTDKEGHVCDEAANRGRKGYQGKGPYILDN